MFLDVIKSNKFVFSRVASPQKLARLRDLATILSNRYTTRADLVESLSTIMDVEKTEDLIKLIKS